MSKFLHKFLLCLGFLSLFHAAYSAAQHRSYLRLNELDFTHLPLDVCILQFVLIWRTLYYFQDDFTFEEFKNVEFSKAKDVFNAVEERSNPSFCRHVPNIIGIFSFKH